MEERAYRDPVHDFITVEESLYQRLIDTPEFQRLRRIRQLGATYGTYHGAEHSRFGHSLGAMWIMRKILDRLIQTGVRISAWTRTVALCAALLHDVGHGPYSHALEGVLTPGRNHEDWTEQVILGPTGVHAVLREYDAALPTAVAAVCRGIWDGPTFVTSLVSSQLDVDRMDYLLRDSLYTGVTYGRYDLERLINTLLVVDEDVVLMRKGISAAEEYVLARYFMYLQVYLHKTTRGQEVMVRRLWERARHLGAERPQVLAELPRPLQRLLGPRPSLADYLAVDDTDITVGHKALARGEDPVLRDLAGRFLDRRLFKSVFKWPQENVPWQEKEGQIKAILRQHGWDPDAYLLVDRTDDVAYDTYTEAEWDEHHRPILALDEYGRPEEIARLSHTIRAVASRRNVAVNVYVPADCVVAVRQCFLAS